MRFFLSIVLLAAAVLWASGLSTTIAHRLYDAGVIVDDYRFGDLYRFSALPAFKQPQPVCPPAQRASDTARTHLYILGDSFTEPERLSKSDFRVSHYQRTAWDHRQRVQLDPTKRNVLLIESVERHVRERFPEPVVDLVVERDINQTPTPRPLWYERIADDWHRTDVEQRLESTLFSHDWAMWFKELKAHLTLRWFDRTNPNVALSRNKQHLFLYSDVDNEKPLNSSFSPLTDREVDRMVDSLNVTADRFRRLGFDAVYVSIIPNKASILEPNRGPYNHLIERLQQHPRLRVPMVDTYGPFRRSLTSPFLQGDTHWTCQGRAIWLDAVRKAIGV